MAAQPIVRESYKIPVETYETNVIGTVNILEALRSCKSVKAFVNVTTDKVYENREWVWGYRESEPFGGYDPYSNSKACSELVTASYRQSYYNPADYTKHGVGIATARAGNVIGGGDWAVDRIIPDCIRATLKNEIIIVRNPDAIRPWQHVLEPLNGYLTLAQKLFSEGGRYAEGWNFGPSDEDCVAVGMLVGIFCSEWGEKARFEIHSDGGPHEAYFLKLDCSKAKRYLNWQPVWNLQKAINAIASWEKGFNAGESPRKLCESQIKCFMADL
jgi:CDP-glucose 4,6-dehydratase